MFPAFMQYTLAHIPNLPAAAMPAKPPKTTALAETKPTRRPPLVPERIDLFEGDEPAEEKVAAFLATVIPAAEEARQSPARALVAWVCDVLLSEHSVRAYGRDLAHFACHMRDLDVDPLSVNADHIKLYKGALLKAGITPATIARRLSVLRGTYRQFAEKGLIHWETAQDIAAIKAPPVMKNTTPALTTKQAVSLLEVIPTETLKGLRDFALISTFFITGCRLSAIIAACVGHLEHDGVEHYLQVTEKRNKKSRKILLDAARAVLAYVEAAGIWDDLEGALFRPMDKSGLRLDRRHMDRKTPWRLIKKYCRAAGINPDRIDGRGIGIHSLRKTAINDAIRNGAQMHEVREFAGHSDIRTTELYFVHKEEDAEMAARRIQIRVSSKKTTFAMPRS
jgi:site-specific recombinase XerD